MCVPVLCFAAASRRLPFNGRSVFCIARDPIDAKAQPPTPHLDHTTFRFYHNHHVCNCGLRPEHAHTPLNAIGPAAQVTVISGRRLTKAITCCETDELVDPGTQTRPIPPPTHSAECDPVLSGAACWKLWKALGRLGLPLPLPAELPSAGSRVAEISPAPAARTTTTTTTRPRAGLGPRTKQNPPEHGTPNQQPGPRPASLSPRHATRALAKGPTTPEYGAESHPAGAMLHRRQHPDLAGGDPLRIPGNGIADRCPVPAAQVVKDRLLRPLLSHVHPSSVAR